MINLLPPNDKKQILAGLSNTLLIRYCVATLLLTIPLLLLLIGGYLVMMNAKSVAQETIEQSTAKSAEYDSVRSESKEFIANLNTAKSILSKEIRYSKIAVAIAQTLPDGMSLESLSLNPESFGQPIALSARGGSHSDAIKFKNALEKSDIFHDVQLQTSQQSEDGGVQITIIATIDEELKNL